MAQRSTIFDGVDPELAALVEGVARDYQPYGVNVTSGYRAGDPRFHGKHMALDYSLTDRQSGRALPNIGNAESAPAYQAFAQEVYRRAMAQNPELAAKMRWGGYFKGGKNPLDLMHIDIGGGQGGVPMAGGSWEGGFSPEQLQAWGIKNAGGIGTQPATNVAAGGDPKAAFLASIAAGESPGYDVMYGGEKFSDFSKHPHRSMPIFDKAHPGQVTGHSSAAGKYQFLGDTWDEQAAKYGYKDFKPETQDLAAWNYANDVFKQNTGGSLEEALQSGDAGRINAAAQVLNKTWSSLPGGVGQAKAYGGGGKTFYDVYSQNLAGGSPAAGGGSGPTVRHPPNPTVGTTAPKAKKRDWSKLGDGLGELETPKFAPYQVPPQPAAVLSQAQTINPVDPAQVQAQRQQMAEALARLNSGQLFGGL